MKSSLFAKALQSYGLTNPVGYTLNDLRQQQKLTESKLAKAKADQDALFERLLQQNLEVIPPPETPEPIAPQENNAAVGIGALAALLGARPQFVNQGLDNFRATKQAKAARVNLTDQLAYQARLEKQKAEQENARMLFQRNEAGVRDLENQLQGAQNQYANVVKTEQQLLQDKQKQYIEAVEALSTGKIKAPSFVYPAVARANQLAQELGLPVVNDKEAEALFKQVTAASKVEGRKALNELADDFRATTGDWAGPPPQALLQAFQLRADEISQLYDLPRVDFTKAVGETLKAKQFANKVQTDAANLELRRQQIASNLRLDAVRVRQIENSIVNADAKMQLEIDKFNAGEAVSNSKIEGQIKTIRTKQASLGARLRAAQAELSKLDAKDPENKKRIEALENAIAQDKIYNTGYEAQIKYLREIANASQKKTLTFKNFPSKYEGIVNKAASKYKLDKNLLLAVIEQESGFRANARSPVGAMGLMQLMPGTAKELGVRDPWDPEQNVMGGAKYLRRMLDMFNGNVQLALAAYNAGPSRVQKLGRVPNIAETKNYVAKITARLANATAQAKRDTSSKTSSRASAPASNKADSELKRLGF